MQKQRFLLQIKVAMTVIKVSIMKLMVVDGIYKPPADYQLVIISKSIIAQFIVVFYTTLCYMRHSIHLWQNAKISSKIRRCNNLMKS